LQQAARELGDVIDPRNALASLQIWVGSSKSDEGIIALSSVLREIFQDHGAIVFPQSQIPGGIDDAVIQEQLRRVDLIAMLAITPGVSAEALEICTTNTDASGKMIVYMPDEYRNGFIYAVLSKKYHAQVKTFPLSQLQQNEATLCSEMFGDALGVVLHKRRKEKLMPRLAPRIAIITALPEEYKAAKRILQNPLPDRTRLPQSIYKEYLHGTIRAYGGGDHKVVLGLAGVGNNQAAIRATQLIRDFATVEEIFMVGIAAGVPNPTKAEEHVRLGDIVVSDKMGVIQYDMIKKRSFSIEPAHPPRPPDADWVRRVLHYFADPPSPPRYWSYLDEILEELSAKRPFAGPLRDCPWVESGVTIRQPQGPERTARRPKLHTGPIGSANTVLKSARIRNRLRTEYKLKAIEMEGSGIADAAWEHGKGYMIVRGIPDFANDDKNNKWRVYAAVVAAAFTRELIETMPVRSANLAG
jgi:nucleoside phosphorylase